MLKHKLIKYWPFLVIFLVSFFALWPLLRPGFFPIHDDLQVLRLFEMEKCFQDGQIPCRWAPDLGGGFGLPMFNYYAPLVYYLGMVFRLLGFSFLASIKLLFLTGILLSGFAMFLLAREFWGKFGGLVSATLYLFAPFHALDIYVRGDLAEFFALAILPLVFWSFYRVFKEKDSRFWLLACFSLTAFLLSHNLTLILALPLLLIWGGFWLVTLRKTTKRAYLRTFSAGLIGLGLAAFFLLPAWLEKSLVQLESLTTGYFDFRAHFITLGQLFFDRSWGYGASWFGPIDSLSFQIGWPHWWLVIISGAFGLWQLRKRQSKQAALILLMVGLFFLFAFMTHPRSLFIWEKISLLHFAQFPWRLIGLIVFISSFVGGSFFLVLREKRKLGIFLTALIIGLTIFLNFNYFKPAAFLTLTDEELLAPKPFFDFLPKDASPPDFNFSEPLILEGEAGVKEFYQKSDYFNFKFETYDNQSARIVVPTFNFPNWEVFIDEEKVPIEENQWGLISVKSPPGKYEISGWLENTEVRFLANGLSLLSLMFLILYLVVDVPKIKKK
jgi:hypothetical protein